MNCRFCAHPLKHSFCDLGKTPLSNAYLKPEALSQIEPTYNLHAFVCSRCFLVQVGEFASPDQIFGDYAYFSSFSKTWLLHTEAYAEQMVKSLGLDGSCQVVEIASNDGYLLQFFQKEGIPILGIEPAQNVARVAMEKGIPTRAQFFSAAVASELVKAGVQADLLIANNVLAHVPNLNDFIGGMKILLKPQGCITVEFPHLLSLIRENQFDTIYHEHFSYFSLATVEKVFAAHKLKVFDVEEIATHGGSLRLFVCHEGDVAKREGENKARIKAEEAAAGLDALEAYAAFESRALAVKGEIVSFLERVLREGKTVAGYGAPAKGNTLLNYCGIDARLMPYTVDISPYKQGHFLPGSRIPIYSPAKIQESKPDYLFILPWNIKEEIMEQMACVRSWGGKFVIPIPDLQVVS